MNLEKLLYGFTITDKNSPHSICIDKHCLAKGNNSHGACITGHLAKYLAQQQLGYHEFKNDGMNNLSDWSLLDAALTSPNNPLNSKILDHFAASKIYRLRYAFHRSLGKTFVLELLRKFRSFLSWDEILWGQAVTSELIAKYEKVFLQLCDECEKTSPGGIYRLYDLLEGEIAVEARLLTLHRFLSLLFAFGHAVSSEKLLSISQLVARYQFFYAFTKEATAFLRKYFGCSVVQSAPYLKSATPFVNKLWNNYKNVSAELFSVDTQSLLNNVHVKRICEELTEAPKTALSAQDNSVFQLRAAFGSAICISGKTQSPIPFKSLYEVTYHPFKHAEECSRFFKRERTTLFDENIVSDQDLYLYVRESVVDYLHMIKEIITTGEIIKAQPDQFSPGSTFKFQKKQAHLGRDKTYGVFVNCHPGGVSYLLSCF